MRCITLGLAIAATGCAATVDGTARDGGAADVPPPVDARTGPCQWRARPAVDVTPRSVPRYRLVDAIATEDGAWVAYRFHLPGRDTDALYVARLREDGSPHPDVPEGSTARADLFGLPFRASLEFSMTWDPARRTLATLSEAETDRGGCVWTATEGANARTIRTLDPSSLMPGFARAGCRALLPTRDGYSFVSEQVRALWGTDLLTLSRAGDLLGFRSLPMTEAPAEQGISRIRTRDNGFVATWVETRGVGMARESSLRARRFSEDGLPVGPQQVIARSASTLKNALLVETSAGLVALYEGSADTFPVSDALLTHALDPQGAPAREPEAQSGLGFFLGGLSATTRGDEVLATAVGTRDGIRLAMLRLDARGSLRGQIDTGLNDVDGPTRTARVVATPSGALVFATVAQGAEGGVVVAVPMRCE